MDRGKKVCNITKIKIYQKRVALNPNILVQKIPKAEPNEYCDTFIFFSDKKKNKRVFSFSCPWGTR